MEINRLNMRVYGILEWQNQILVVHEKMGVHAFTKFPGGGLELGEGTRDCLIREFMEETGMTIEVGNHIYTTDFFQQSAFRETDQLISVYYKVHPVSDPALISQDEITVIENGREEILKFFWVPLPDLHENLLTFPIDKLVVSMIQSR
jgi:8-oxo-dGTP pyrophosphatase MutT (NUDIX family)